MPRRQTLTESTPLAAGATAGGSLVKVQLITPGWGSSGYYSPAVLAEAAGSRVFPTGTHMYLDHPTAQEAADRPERSVRDLAAVLTTDATVDPATGGLVAEARVFAPYQGVIAEMADAIGVSIRATGTGSVGEAEGRRGLIIDRLDEGLSVDFVTAAGRGGRVLELLESARTTLAEAGTVGAWIESRLHLALTQLADDMYGDGRLSRDERITLSTAIGDGLKAWTARITADAPQLFDRSVYDCPTDAMVAEAAGVTANNLNQALADALTDAYGGDGVWTWTRDHTDEWVVFDISGDKAPDPGTFQQTFVLNDDGTTTLTGTPVEVAVRTTYVPVSDPQAAPTTTRESEEDPMPELSEAEVRELREAAERVPTVEAENQSLRTQLAEATARSTAHPIVDRLLAASELPAACHATVREAALRAVPLTEAHVLDEAAFTTTVTEAIDVEKVKVAAIAESLGAGRPRGLGATDTDPVDSGEATTKLTEALTRLGATPTAAEHAARGRI